MATCPRCMGPLTDRHRCPRKKHVRALQHGIAALAGAVAGFVLMALVDPAQHSTHLDIWVIAGAALATSGAWHVLSRD